MAAGRTGPTEMNMSVICIVNIDEERSNGVI